MWAALLGAVAGGLALDLAFPDAGVWPLAFVGVGLSLVSLIGRSAGGAFLVGLAFAASFWFTHVSWTSRYLGVLPWFALAGFESLLSAVGAVGIALAYRWMPRVAPGTTGRVLGLPLLVAGVWTARELWLGTWPYTGFPWGRIGMSQSESPLAALASWLGVTGLTFVMVFAVAAAIEAVRCRRTAHWRGGVPALAALVALVAVPAFPTADAGTWRVGAVQGNGPAAYFDTRAPYAVFEAQRAATFPLVGEDLDVVVWPEGGVDADPTNNVDVAEELDRLAERLDAPLLLNAATRRGDDIFNTSMLWVAGSDNPVAMHDKTRPVPFGEYVPDRWFYRLFAPDLIDLIQREYTPGTIPPFFDVDGVGVGLAICFDVIYDDVIWSGVRDGAQVLVFQTNNADFRDTDENLQQLAFARMRAIETGRAVVNISTVGTSQVIAPDGRELDALDADVAGAMVTDVPLREGRTPAVVIGFAVQLVVGWGSVLALLATGVLVRRRREEPVPSPQGTDTGSS
ncbi:apolipoprotein N-acyltransferase [Microbacterium sp. No. 7]|uniref:apolipoprotein N-acyltransferase n=1 Tax=Microbacterium sp. No. 7 TaxID=1714373 RepID=UPI0018D02AD8|nr:apolipoprotein N-acyltransferase [Microbacterium sp. No. 7]